MSKITKEDISNAIEKWREESYQYVRVETPAYYEYLKKNKQKYISEEGREGLDEYIIYCGQKIYKSRPITNN